MEHIRVYTPHRGTEAIRDAFASLVRERRQAGELAWRLFRRDLSAAHRQSLLGWVWVVLPPLANALVWIFLNSQRVIRVDSGNVSYPVFVLSGTILWAAFNGGLMALLGVVSEARGMLSKVNFPHEALVMAALIKAGLDAFIPAVLLVPVMFLNDAPWPVTAALFPVALAAAMLVGAALGLFLVPAATLYGDVSRAVQLGLRFGFFVTPVIFALPAGGFARTLMQLNPITPVITTGRAWLTGSGEAMPAAFLAVTLAALVLFALSLIVYKVALPRLIERMGG